MNLKLLCKAQLKGVQLYCIVLLVTYGVVWYFSSDQALGVTPRHLQKYLKFSEDYKAPSSELRSRDLAALSATVQLLNFEREVFHQQRYGAVHPHTTIIAVQVHRDAERLQYLIVSLAQARRIQSALVIFSHSFFDENINNMIRSISFCRYMQIFYPLSVQLHPNRFPGIDPEDCLHSSTVDKYCSNRDARLTEHKHHWWWKAYFIFNNLDWSQKYKGTVIFLEENNYVLPDILHMLRYAERSLSSIPWVTVMSFGKQCDRDLDNNLLIADIWRPPYNIGLACNKTVWNTITALSSFFCTYDDLRWDYSLLNLFSRFPEGHVVTVATLAPRVFDTGVYKSGRSAHRSIQDLMRNCLLFPNSVKAAMVLSSTGKVTSESNSLPQAAGGWSDVRDHLLCLEPLSFSERSTEGTADELRLSHR